MMKPVTKAVAAKASGQLSKSSGDGREPEATARRTGVEEADAWEKL